MKKLFLTAVVALIASNAFAQYPQSVPAAAQSNVAAAGETRLAMPTGHDVSVSVASYTYTEPGDQGISIHGAKIGGDYTATFWLNERSHWFGTADVRGMTGAVTYDGWCSPFVLVPSSASPNGYEVDIGDASPCDETGDKDWYAEGRFLAGKDMIGPRWALSPYSGLGLRHLSNGTTGVAGYRTDDYLYLPLGLATRTMVAAQKAFSINLEFDVLLHGWQTTRDSALGGGDVPATDTAPAFTIDGFSDVSFSQSRGLALRLNAKYPVTTHVFVEPYYIYWNVGASPVSDETLAYTVNRVPSQESLGAYEPLNTTHEFGVKVGFHF